MKAILKDRKLKITGENELENDWIREMSKNRIFSFDSSLVGQDLNHITLRPSLGWDFWDFVDNLKELHSNIVTALDGIASIEKQK